MLKILFSFVACILSLALQAQETGLRRSGKIVASRDTIRVDSVSINPKVFRITDVAGKEIDSSFYKVDFAKATLTFSDKYKYAGDTLSISYLRYPDYLTKEYSIYDSKRVVSNGNTQGNLYRVSPDAIKKFSPFEGLETSGSISRGITVGNNQNAVVDSNLDLQITGKISDKVSLRASIQDSNIPLQEGGYSQKLDEFDQIFIELFSEKWNIRAGDLFLENRTSRFLNFSKKVQGVAANVNFGKDGNKTNVFASGALVRGQYARSNFTGQEGNQGPYKLRGSNGELFVLVVSGSERVYVNGILLKRGENNDYVIDYNAGEITFTSLFPITSEMRISIEYQFSDRNYTRFVTYFGASHERKTWSIGANIYSENDVKNQPLQQNLSTEQALILQNAGDDQSKMAAPSAYEDTFSENKTLYRRTLIDGVEIFEYSTDETAILYNVRFSLAGDNQGDYILSNASAVGKIYEYAAPVNGIRQGNYAPIIRLVPPTKIQIATLLGKYNPSEKTSIDFEAGVSTNDQNLFSPIDDSDNNGIAGKLNAKQRLFTGQWKIDAFANYQFIQRDFRTIERLFNIEFDRDWNLTSVSGNQSFLTSGLSFTLPEKGAIAYQFENLDFSGSFSGNRHTATALFKLNNWSVLDNTSLMKSNGKLSDSRFLRNRTETRYHFGRNWVGGNVRFEDNQETIRETRQLSSISQRFFEYGAFTGRGDSTKVYVELGYLNRSNDSLQNGLLKRVNVSDSWYEKSRLIKTEKSDLSIFVNYRNLKFTDDAIKDEPSLNSRILYNDRYFDQLIQTTTAYETTSGTIAQQEYTYLEVDAGKGIYTWNDYNSNGIQELQEFEVAPYPDQAKFIRVFLPNQVFIKTHQNRFSESLTLNPLQWQKDAGFKKLLSYFYNQSSYLIERKIERDGNNFDLNPFSESDKNLLGLNTAFRNSLFYNRGKQYHSVTYTFLESRTRSLLSIGSQESGNKAHQAQYAHLYDKTWLFSFLGESSETRAAFQGFATRNYDISAFRLAPKISYLFTKNASLDVFFEDENKENRITGMEQLKQTRIGTSFSYSSEKKLTMNGEFSLYNNDFTGNALSPAGFQMLEGLLPGKNMTWRLLVQKNLTQYLDINLNYQGRKSETSDTIHTGNVQLRAYF